MKKFVMVCQVWTLVNMNSIEIQECKNVLGTSEGVSMEDYFNHVNGITQVAISDLKIEFKKYYPDETSWSF